MLKSASKDQHPNLVNQAVLRERRRRKDTDLKLPGSHDRQSAEDELPNILELLEKELP
jgi:hypothetical protein